MNNKIGTGYDLFDLIHKGIRAMLYSTGMSLQHNDFRNRVNTMKEFEKINEVLLITNEHSFHEAKIILPLVKKHHVLLVKDLEDEHLKAGSMAHRLKNLMALFHHTVSHQDMREAGHALYKCFNEFIAFNMQHMNREEEELNKLLWMHYSDEEIFCIYKAITNSIPADKIIIHGRWVMRGINNNEIINWLSSYHCSHPEAFIFLLQLAEDELPWERWNDIKDALCEGEMLPCGCGDLG